MEDVEGGCEGRCGALSICLMFGGWSLPGNAQANGCVWLLGRDLGVTNKLLLMGPLVAGTGARYNIM
jgi:hypothetical protein